MRFAVVGDFPQVTPFLRAIARDADHELVSFAMAPRLHAAMFPHAPAARLCRAWEELLSDLRIDAVVVAGHDDDTLRAARQLAGTGKPLFVAPGAGQSASFAYEMTLLEAEQQVTLVPLFGLRAHPIVRRLRETLGSGRIGEVQHVQLERRLDPNDAVPPVSGCVSADDLGAAFLPDADLLRSLWREFGQVTSVRSGSHTGGISMATITLAGSSVPQVVWTATALPGEPHWRLSVVGTLATAILARSSDGISMEFELMTGGSTRERESAAFDEGEWLLGNCPRAVAGGVAAGSLPLQPELTVSYPIWDDFTRASELHEAAERSIRRRRTIEIYFETPSERGQFKTQITPAGCSLLVFTLGAVVVYLTTASLVDLPLRVKQLLVALIFLPLGLFLILQMLLFLARPSASSGGANLGENPKTPSQPEERRG